MTGSVVGFIVAFGSAGSNFYSRVATVALVTRGAAA